MSVLNLAPGRPYDPRSAAQLRGKPAGEDIRFHNLSEDDEIAFVLGVRGSDTTVLTDKAEITGQGTFAINEVDTSGERLFVVVYRPGT